jgi:peptidoglycan/LPS O-acetylase OafA/YrhL
MRGDIEIQRIEGDILTRYPATVAYVDYLLIIRGLASFGVLVAHCFSMGEYSMGSNLALIGSNFVPTTGGNFVLTFFVLSGYLMTTLFLDGRYRTDRQPS